MHADQSRASPRVGARLDRGPVASAAPLDGPAAGRQVTRLQRGGGSSLAITEKLRNRMVLPVIGAPMFIVGNPDLVIEQCKSGIIGSFPALNARPAEVLGQWLGRSGAALAHPAQAHPDAEIAPYAVSQIIHHSNGSRAS